MSGQINNLVPLIRKHFDFLITDLGFMCVRSWNEHMSREQGVEYQSARVTVVVEQPDSPIIEVWLRDRKCARHASLSLDEIMQESDPEAWQRRPNGYAWPRPVEQDDEQLRFLSECTRRYCDAWLRGGSAATPVC